MKQLNVNYDPNEVNEPTYFGLLLVHWFFCFGKFYSKASIEYRDAVNV